MRIIKKLAPPVQWRLPVAIIAGIAFGFSCYLFYISRAWSYVSDSPSACINCHIMAPQYATWMHSAHRNAVCNDCHVPQDNIFRKYFFKASDGLRHATMFTLRLEPQVIFIKEAGGRVVNENCLRCHKNVFIGIETLSGEIGGKPGHEGRKCTECHRETPHGRVNSLSSVPFARVPLLKSPVPLWVQNFIKTSGN